MVLVTIPEVDSEVSSPRSRLESDISDTEEAWEKTGARQSSLRSKCWLMLVIELVSAVLAAAVTAAVVLRQDPVVIDSGGRRLATGVAPFANPYRVAHAPDSEENNTQMLHASVPNPDVSCANWESILLKSGAYSSPDACGQACGSTPGCHSFDYQQSSCVDASGEQGDCHLLGGACERKQRENTNVCSSDVYTMQTPTKEAWYKNSTGYGCANWESIMICSTDMGLSAGACGLKCAGTPGCVGFNYQPTQCSGTEMAFQGACILFSGECERLENACWDFYSMVPENIQQRKYESVGQRLRGGAVSPGAKPRPKDPRVPAQEEPRWRIEPQTIMQ